MKTAIIIIISIIAIVFYALLSIWIWRNYHSKKPIDWRGEFISFMSERQIKVPEISGEPEQWITRMTGYHQYKKAWGKLNKEWIERIRHIKEDER